MTYAFDPELEPLIELFPYSDITDLEAARERTAALVEPINATVDTSGTTVSGATVPGPEGAPEVPVRI
jgi:hypothetical protein